MVGGSACCAIVRECLAAVGPVAFVPCTAHPQDSSNQFGLDATAELISRLFGKCLGVPRC